MAKKVLITGATSGFGKLAVKRLLGQGHSVIAGVRGGAERLQKLFPEEVKTGRLFAADLHLDKPEAAGVALAAVEREFGGELDALVNNAGYLLFGPYEAQTDADIAFQFEVNAFGPMRLTRALLPALKRSKGRVVNISSVAGLVTLPFYATYNASKAALEALTEGLYYDLRSQGVQVTLIEPGSFNTEIVDSSKKGANLAGSPYAAAAARFTAWMDKNMHLAGDPDRVARLIVRRVEQRRIPIRTLIGADAWALAILRRVLPERVRVTVIERLFRWAFLKTPSAEAVMAPAEAKVARISG
jgi:NAD(P)-dependent dehydrogenase (short-subunit alcohol dehydrogenase family)